MSADAHDIQREVKKYYAVFSTLLVLSCVTVAVSRLDLSTGRAIALALAIATVKASLVACVFMHLISEKRFIFMVLALTLVFFVTIMLLPTTTRNDPLHGTRESFLESTLASHDEPPHGALETQETEGGH